MSKIVIPSSDFEQSFPERGFMVKHDLTEEPLLNFDNIASLADRLDPTKVEHNAADVGVDQNPETIKKSDYTARDAILNVENANTWLVLKNVEKDDKYRELIHDTLAGIVAQARRKLHGIKGFEAFIFVSSPNSVTPFHLDPEHNFLLQIKGSKTVNQWSRNDTQTLSASEVEEFVFLDKHRNLKYMDEFASRQTTFELNPGDGLHFPVRAPHWVKNGPTPSVSFSITFRSSESEREFRLFRHNGRRRALGGNPYPVNKNRTVDIVKDTLIRAANKIPAAKY